MMINLGNAAKDKVSTYELIVVRGLDLLEEAMIDNGSTCGR